MSDETRKILFPSQFESIDNLERFCWKELSPDLNRQSYRSQLYKIRTALAEALLNAWKHGNRRTADLPIIVRWRFAGDFVFEVEDQGDGFDFRHVPDPTKGENLFEERGRGIHIIRTCARSVQWKKGGSHIIVTFGKLAPVDSPGGGGGRLCRGRKRSPQTGPA